MNGYRPFLPYTLELSILILKEDYTLHQMIHRNLYLPLLETALSQNEIEKMDEFFRIHIFQTRFREPIHLTSQNKGKN